MFRIVLATMAVSVAGIGPLLGQRPHLDSATTAQAYAHCGAIADDSVWVDSLWAPSAQTIVSVHAYRLKVPELRSPTGAPEYPEHLRREHVQGRVVAVAIVGVNGRIEEGSIKVLATPHPDFIPVVERYISNARFTAGELRGKPTRVCIVMPMDFHTR